jgi:hypothetical protein
MVCTQPEESSWHALITFALLLLLLLQAVPVSAGSGAAADGCDADSYSADATVPVALRGTVSCQLHQYVRQPCWNI